MIIFLYGEDVFRSREKLKETKIKFIREVDPQGDSLITLDGETVTMDKINSAIATPSLFSSKRMIVIENIFSNKDKEIFDSLFEYLKLKNYDDNLVVFWDDISGAKMGKNKLFKFLSSQKFSYVFNKLSNVELTNWIKMRVSASGLQIDNRANFILAGMFDGDLWQLSGELDKLVNFKLGQKENKIISEAEVQDLVHGKTDQNIFALMDAISQRNRQLGVELLEKELEAGITEQYLLSMIIRQFRILLQVRECLDNNYLQNDIVAKLKLHPFVVQKSMAQAQNFSLALLRGIFQRLIEVDYEMKTGQTDIKTVISLLIARV